MTTFYLVRSFLSTVTPVEVERSNDISVWVNGRRRARESVHDIYFEMEGAAWDYLVNRADDNLEAAQSRLDAAKAAFGVVSAKRNDWMKANR